MKLLTTGNPKTAKGEKYGYVTAILHLAPANLSGHCVCPNASRGCREACLNKAGRSGIPLKSGELNSIQKCRIERTRMFFNDREKFLKILKNEIRLFVKRCRKFGKIPCVRLNGTSDLPWERFGIMEAFPDVQFYDYTKNPHRALAFVNGQMPPNYHLTFSRSENNEEACLMLSAQGVNVAVVFDSTKKMDLPKKHYGVDVIDADKTDLRFLDRKGVVCGLRYKHLKRDDSTHGGFIVKVGANGN